MAAAAAVHHGSGSGSGSDSVLLEVELELQRRVDELFSFNFRDTLPPAVWADNLDLAPARAATIIIGSGTSAHDGHDTEQEEDEGGR